jgi:CRP-like cAMP-binding protein
MSPTEQHKMPGLSPPTFPSAAVVKRNAIEYKKGARIFTQGDASKHVLYIQQGGVKLSVVNKGGKEAVIGILAPDDFFGEGCMSGLPFRMSTATAIMGTKLLVIEKKEMIRALHSEHAFSDRLILAPFLYSIAFRFTTATLGNIGGPRPGVLCFSVRFITNSFQSHVGTRTVRNST